MIKSDLGKADPVLLEAFRVNGKDRKYLVWERNPHSIEIYSQKVMKQKLKYIHENPLQEKWVLCRWPEEYNYSSAYFLSYGQGSVGLFKTLPGLKV